MASGCGSPRPPLPPASLPYTLLALPHEPPLSCCGLHRICVAVPQSQNYALYVSLVGVCSGRRMQTSKVSAPSDNQPSHTPSAASLLLNCVACSCLSCNCRIKHSSLQLALYSPTSAREGGAPSAMVFQEARTVPKTLKHDAVQCLSVLCCLRNCNVVVTSGLHPRAPISVCTRPRAIVTC